MDDFNIVFPKEKEYTDRQKHIKFLKVSFFDKNFTYSSWEYTEERCGLWNISTQDKLAVYNLSGAICHKMLQQKIQCQNCKDAFGNRLENLIHGCEEANNVNASNRGGLIHPNINLFNLCSSLENMFAYRVQHKLFGSMFGNLCKDIPESNCTFPCADHGSEMLATIFYDYLIMRMRQFALFFKRGQDQSAKEKRKSAKHEDT